jgi:hypothetical protein
LVCIQENDPKIFNVKISKLEQQIRDLQDECSAKDDSIQQNKRKLNELQV